MGGRGPAPKPPHLRQRTNKKAGATVIAAPDDAAIPALTHPSGEAWHPGTIEAWREFFESPMASQWLPTDITGLVMLAVCYDRFYKTGDLEFLKEIRLQRPHYGLTPLDRSRLQWKVTRGEEAEQKRAKPAQSTGAKPGEDLRKLMKIVNG